IRPAISDGTGMRSGLQRWAMKLLDPYGGERVFASPDDASHRRANHEGPTSRSRPSFETPAFGGLLRMRGSNARMAGSRGLNFPRPFSMKLSNHRVDPRERRE